MEFRVKPLGMIALIVVLFVGALAAIRFMPRTDAPVVASSLPDTTPSGEIVLVTSATKKDWLQEQIERFNAASKGKMSVRVEFIETRDALLDILHGKVKPGLWAPSSPVWTRRLGEEWAREHAGKQLLDASDPATFRVYLRTPLVFLTTQDKAKTLRPLLSESSAWSAVRDLSVGKKNVPWSPFKFSYSDPIASNSGFMTLSMIMADYGKQTGKSGNLETVAKDPQFLQLLSDMNKRYVYDEPAQKGSSDLFKAFVADHKRYDFISTYESNAIGAAAKDPTLAVIYPTPTVVSEQSIVLLSGADWLNPAQKAIGQAFLKFLAEKESLQSGVKANFRPAQPTPDVTIDPTLSKLASQGFQQSFISVEIPPYEAVNEAAFEWQKRATKVH